ncbi:Clp protease [Dactylosporangium aurantiacum]|uniref:Clp protease n=1 Tax=Dactylosporangium aurantiacum TaxID=35754 RepID=A0A9Q9IHW7_9ACTN|nr:Clp protease N-terminal domain-containing protein [Dactylosporangium aurantiacum]MDG6102246.1 Clp protease N-terminal domain-containing protein [Dactylosporangium aurantiacum]UWZ53443.1 Clp protease [Dactylosporangium aurantiacum]
MFERFTTRARTVVQSAHEEADALGHRTVGTEHLVLAMFTAGGIAADVLRACGVEAEQLRATVAGADDAAALRSVGIDLDAVREKVEETFGPGALERAEPPRRGGFFFRRTKLSGRFGNDAKKALELSLRVALSMKHNYIGTEHLLLGVLRDERGAGGRLLREQGMTYERTMELVRAALRNVA